MESFQEMIFKALAGAVIKQAKERGEIPVSKEYILKAILLIEKNDEINPDSVPMLERIYRFALRLENESAIKH